MSDLTVHICPKTGMMFDGLTINDRCPPVDTGDPSIVLLRPVNTFSLDVSIMPTTDCIDSMIAALGGIELSCSRGILYDYRGQFRGRMGYLTFRWTNWPNDFCGGCGWKGTTITRRNMVTLTNGAFLAERPVVVDYGYVPQGDEPIHNLDRESSINITGPECVPGEYIMLNWVLLIGGEVKTRQVAAFVFDTPAIMGGKVTNTGGGVTVGRTITVDFFEWGEQVLVPTDFADHQVGSWVFVLKCGASSADDTNQESAYEMGDSYPASDFASEALRLTNLERTSRGLTAFTGNSQLNTAAERHAADMAENDFLSHTGSDGSSSAERITLAGYLSGMADGAGYKTGENVAVGSTSAAEVVARWMNSPGHRANILDPVFAEIGIAYAETDRGKPYWVQDFGWRSDADATVTDVTGWRPVPITVNQAQNHDLVDDGGMETIDLSLVDDLSRDFETAVHEGVVASIDRGNNTADVTIAKFSTTFLNVPIFYHCPNTPNVDSGHQAFAVADEVIILNENGGAPVPAATDLTVVGLKSGLKLCHDAWVVVFQNGGEYAFVEIDKTTGAASQKDMYHPTTYALLSQPITPSGYTLTQLMSFNGLNVAVPQQPAQEAVATFVSDTGPFDYTRAFVADVPGGALYSVGGRSLGTFMTGFEAIYDVGECPRDPAETLNHTTQGQLGAWVLKALLPPRDECVDWTGVGFGGVSYGVSEYDTCTFWGGIYNLVNTTYEHIYDVDSAGAYIVDTVTIDTVDGGFYYADGIGIAWVKIKTNNHYIFRVYFESGMPVKSPGPPATYNYNVGALSEIMSAGYITGFFGVSSQPQIYGVYKSY